MVSSNNTNITNTSIKTRILSNGSLANTNFLEKIVHNKAGITPRIKILAFPPQLSALKFISKCIGIIAGNFV